MDFLGWRGDLLSILLGSAALFAMICLCISLTLGLDLLLWVGFISDGVWGDW